MELLYTKINRNRLPKFQIGTTVYKNGNGKWVEKRALNREGLAHIRSIYDNFELLTSLYPIENIVQASVSHDTIKFDFVEGLSLESALLQTVTKNDGNAFRHLIDEYKRFVYQVEDCVLAEHFEPCMAFQEVFGNLPAMNQVYCAEHTNLDMIFPNIIRKTDGSLVSIDYEWVFSFRIPLDFVIYRSVKHFYYKYVERMARFTQLDNLWEMLGIREQERQVYGTLEDRFHDYVYGKDSLYQISTAYQKQTRRVREMGNTEKFLSTVSQLTRNRPLFIWGAGAGGEKAYGILKEYVEPKGFIDSNPKKWGSTLCGRPIVGPSQIWTEDGNKPYIVIGSMYGDQIKEELRRHGYNEGIDYCTSVLDSGR